MRGGARRAWACAFLAVCGCSNTHVPPDAPLDASASTEMDRLVVAYFTAQCEAAGHCPLGSSGVGRTYAHGIEQCLRESAADIAYYQRELRDGRMRIRDDRLASCWAELRRGCPDRGLRGDPTHEDTCEPDWVFVSTDAPGLDEACDLQLPCADGLICDFGGDSCGWVCRPLIAAGRPCDDGDRCGPNLGLTHCREGVCPSVVRREGELGESCGRHPIWPDFELTTCRHGLACSRESQTCLELPDAGEDCMDGRCAAGSYCDPARGSCRALPLEEGVACEARGSIADPCDRAHGVACVDGRCTRATGRLGEPCAGECEEGYCGSITSRCEPFVTFDDGLADGAPCRVGVECISRRCDRNAMGEYVCTPVIPPCE